MELEPEADYMRRDSGPIETGGPSVFYGFDPDNTQTLVDAQAKLAAASEMERLGAARDWKGIDHAARLREEAAAAIAAAAPVRTVGTPYQRPVTAAEAAAKLADSIARQNALANATTAPPFPWFAVGIGAAVLALAIYRNRK